MRIKKEKVVVVSGAKLPNKRMTKEGCDGLTVEQVDKTKDDYGCIALALFVPWRKNLISLVMVKIGGTRINVIRSKIYQQK